MKHQPTIMEQYFDKTTGMEYPCRPKDMTNVLVIKVEVIDGKIVRELSDEP